MSEQLSTEDNAHDAHAEWHEDIGQRLMLAMTCNHGSEYFGSGAVCETCFANVQRVGRIIEKQAAHAWDQGRAAERRDWELTAVLSSPDGDHQRLSAEEALIQRAEDACRPCGPCDSGLPMGCDCDPEPRAVIAGLLDTLTSRAARTADLFARLAAVEAVLVDEPPLLTQIRADLGEGFPNELSERRGRTITGWVDRLRVALHPAPSEACPTPGCPGDFRYAPPGRGHLPGCRYPTQGGVTT